MARYPAVGKLNFVYNDYHPKPANAGYSRNIKGKHFTSWFGYRSILKHTVYWVWKILSLNISKLVILKLPTRFSFLFLFIVIINWLLFPKTVLKSFTIILVLLLTRLGGFIGWWLAIRWWRVSFRLGRNLTILICCHNRTTHNTILVSECSTFPLFWTLNIRYNTHIFFSLFL